jgi:adenylate cyclase, class 2
VIKSSGYMQLCFSATGQYARQSNGIFLKPHNQTKNGYPMTPLEIEVKFYLARKEPVRSRILEIGAECLGRVFETNLIFDDPEEKLNRSRSLLRLRKGHSTTLTFKSPTTDEDNRFKILKELEVSIDDFLTMRSILESLGFNVRRVYEKWRETFTLNNTNLCIDTMPFGTFMEIEGEKSAIMETADLLDLDWKQRIVQNYHELFIIVKTARQLAFSDITFENFKEAGVKPESLGHMFHIK